MNVYFEQVFTKVFEKMYNAEIHQLNELQNVSDAINDITDNCDSSQLQRPLFDFLNNVL